MGLILGIITAILTFGVVVMIILANGMSDAPGDQGIRVWPALLVGGCLTAGFILTHYHPILW